jgi:hypothetical protein
LRTLIGGEPILHGRQVVRYNDQRRFGNTASDDCAGLFASG